MKNSCLREHSSLTQQFGTGSYWAEINGQETDWFVVHKQPKRVIMKKRREVHAFCWRVSVSLSDQVYTALMFLVNFAIKVFRLLSTDSSTMVYQLLLATNKNSRAERRSITFFAESQTEGTGDFCRKWAVWQGMLYRIFVPPCCAVFFHFISRFFKYNGFSNTVVHRWDDDSVLPYSLHYRWFPFVWKFLWFLHYPK